MVTCKLGLPLSTKIFNFNLFVNTLDLDEFLLNPDIPHVHSDPAKSANISLRMREFENNKLIISASELWTVILYPY